MHSRDYRSWKLQHLDLSRLGEGEFERQEKFGYFDLPDGISLKDAIDLEGYLICPEFTDDDTLVKIVGGGVRFDMTKNYSEFNRYNAHENPKPDGEKE